MPSSRSQAVRRPGFFGSEEMLKRLRYVMSSGASVVVGQTVLAFTFGILHWSAAVANVVSFVVAGVVAYLLHRRWTWRRRGRSGLRRELLPYWAIAVVSLVLSTWLVDVAEDASVRMELSRGLATLLVMATAFVVNGVFWVIKYVVFDRLFWSEDPVR